MAVESIQNYQNAVNCNVQNKMNLSFEGKKKGNAGLSENPDSFEKVDEQKASTAKKVGLGIASWIAPGLGQLINGEIGKGLAFFGATFLAGFLRGKLPIGNVVNPSKFKILPGMLPVYIGSIAVIGAKVWSTIDAILKAKPDAKEA